MFENGYKKVLNACEVNFFSSWINPSVPDPDSLSLDPDPTFSAEKFITKIKAEKRNFILVCLNKSCSLLNPLGLHKGRPSYRRSLQPSKENIQQP